MVLDDQGDIELSAEESNRFLQWGPASIIDNDYFKIFPGIFEVLHGFKASQQLCRTIVGRNDNGKERVFLSDH